MQSILIMAAAIVVFIISLIIWSKRQSELNWLTHNGIRVDALVTGVEKQYRTQYTRHSMIMTQRAYYYIIAQWTNPATGELKTFKSDRYTSHPDPVEGATIAVYYDPNNVRRYYAKMK